MTLTSAGGVVSSVKLKLVIGEMLPAASVCRTSTLLGPSTAVKALLQVLPPSVEYSTSAPGSTPARASVPSLVTWSIAVMQVSFARDTPGTAGGVESIVLVGLAI